MTQVADPHRSTVFHTRLTHSLEVAQIGRRIAEKLLAESPELAAQHGIDADVIEAAALAHDIGHPPFGHVGEEVLDQAVRDKRCQDGFEGNAQSFRVITRLSAHSYKYRGLDLCRATLNAVLKYPWKRDLLDHTSFRFRKFGVYRSDTEDFEFARGGCEEGRRSAEAEIMDFADSVAYSVHDIQDFYKAGLIPPALAFDDDEFDHVFEEWLDSPHIERERAEHRREHLRNRIKQVLAEPRYFGSRSQRSAMITEASTRIQEAVFAVRLEADGPATLRIDDAIVVEHKFFQRVLWKYVIDSPQLGTQQMGHRRIVETLFDLYSDAIESGRRAVLPSRFADEYEELQQSGGDPVAAVRLAADIVASLTDAQAAQIYRRVLGVEPGSVQDPIG